MGNQTNAIERATGEIETVLSECNTMALRELPALGQAVKLASGISQLRKVLTEDLIKQVFMPLSGSPLGFVTDKDRDGGYPPVVVRDCLIEALVHGLRPVGNEFNIISGRCYAAKNGYLRLVQEYPGLTDLVLYPGVPHTVSGGALVPYRATWRLSGTPQELVCDVSKRADDTVTDGRIPVRVNSGMGADAIIGKATRKMLKRIYDMVSGSTLGLSDGEAIDTVGEVQSEPTPAPALPEQDGRRLSLGGKKNGQPAAQEAEQQELREPGQEG